MAIQVLGISGSPVPDSNTDRAVKAILRHSGLASHFIKLSDLQIGPCRACLSCKEDHHCALEDDGRSLANYFAQVPAFVLGAYTPYGSLDARTKTFMERMFCLRHQTGSNVGKVGVSVITTACPASESGRPPAELAQAQIAAWMAAEGMENLGSLVLQGNSPCSSCGHGDDCPVSAVKLAGSSPASRGVRLFEDDPALAAAAHDLGQRLCRAVLNR